MNSEQGVTLALDRMVIDMQNTNSNRRVSVFKKLGQGGFGVVMLGTTDDGTVCLSTLVL